MVNQVYSGYVVREAINGDGFGIGWYHYVNLSPRNVFCMYIISVVLYIILVLGLFTSYGEETHWKIESVLSTQRWTPPVVQPASAVAQPWQRVAPLREPRRPPAGSAVR